MTYRELLADGCVSVLNTHTPTRFQCIQYIPNIVPILHTPVRALGRLTHEKVGKGTQLHKETLVHQVWSFPRAVPTSTHIVPILHTPVRALARLTHKKLGKGKHCPHCRRAVIDVLILRPVELRPLRMPLDSVKGIVPGFDGRNETHASVRVVVDAMCVWGLRRGYW